MNRSSPLLLSSPQIAGLLPAHAESLTSQDRNDSVKETFVYRNERLTRMSHPQRERLTTAMQILMDVAVAFTLNEGTESALRAAELLFHKSAGGLTTRPRTPQAYYAQRNAELIEWYAETTHRLAVVRNEGTA